MIRWQPWMPWGAIAGKVRSFKKTRLLLRTHCKISFKTIETDPVGTLTNVVANIRAGSSLSRRLTKHSPTYWCQEVPRTEVDAELEQLKATSPEYINLVGESMSSMAKTESVSQDLTWNMQNITAMTNAIRENVLTIDGLNRSISARQCCPRSSGSLYLKGMEQRAKERLLKYHYYMAKAYEYRMLEPYPGDLNLNSLFNKFMEIVGRGSGYTLTEGDFGALKTVYEEQLSTIAEIIYDQYISNPPDMSSSLSFSLDSSELQKLNSGQTVTKNLVDWGFFLPSEENIRIVDLRVRRLRRPS